MVLSTSLFYFRRKKLSIDTQYRILYRIQQLNQNGYSLNDALEIVSWDDELELIADRISHSLQHGKTLPTALEEVHFQQRIVHFLEITIKHGNLQDGIKHCSFLLQQQKNYVDRFKQMNRYPLFLFIFFLLILFCMKRYIFPSFVNLFHTNGSNAIFQNAMLTVDIIFYGIFILIIFSLLLMLSIKYLKDKVTIETKLKVFQVIPLLKQYKTLEISFYFSTHLSSLLKTGLNFKNALSILQSERNEPITSFYASTIIDHLVQGFHLETILPSCELLKREMSRIMQKDRNTSQIAEDLQLYAEHLLFEMEELMKKWLKMIQPIFLILLATLILIVYLALMLPMFDYIQTI